MDTRLPDELTKVKIRRPRSEHGTGFFDVALAVKTARDCAKNRKLSALKLSQHVQQSSDVGRGLCHIVKDTTGTYLRLNLSNINRVLIKAINLLRGRHDV